MMVQANFTQSAQTKFWAEAVSCANYLENLTIKSNRELPELEIWTGKGIKKRVKYLVQFGRVGVANDKGNKVKAKMSERGNVIMMVGYAANHSAGVYRVYNPKTNRIVFSQDVTWDDFKSKKLNDRLDVFSDDDKSDNTYQDESTISSDEYDFVSTDDELTETESSESNAKAKRKSKAKQPSPPKQKTDVNSSESSSSDESSSSNESSDNDEDDESSSNETSNTNGESAESKIKKSKSRSKSKEEESTISKPIATRRTRARQKAEMNARKKKDPPSVISVPKTKSKNMKLRSGRMKSNETVKRVTGDTKPKK